jgi:Fe-coproporphyrin III synthase
VNSLINLAAPAMSDELDPRHHITSLPILVLHAHTSCNCRCLMCDIWKIKDGRSFTAAQLAPHLDSIHNLGVRWVVFSGGEPLMSPEFPALCEILRREQIRLTLLTSGLLLEKRAAEVAASFDDVIVSLDGPPPIHDEVRRVKCAFELLRSGIAAVRRRNSAMRFTARTTVQKANHVHLRETILAAHSLQLDALSFLAVDVTSEAFNRASTWSEAHQAEVALSEDEVRVLAAEVEAVISDYPADIQSGFISESPEKLRRIVRHFQALLGLEKPHSPACNAPWVSAVIETDGTVRPCFFHAPLGSLQTATLEQILNSQQALSFRASLDIPANPICNRCVCSLNYRA